VRVLLQRVLRASVRVDGETTGAIGRGVLLLVGVGPEDSEEQLTWMANKVAALRIFPDDEGKMNRSVAEAAGAALIVSQFTLYGDVRKGNRPSFIGAAPPERAEELVERFSSLLAERLDRVEGGRFGADMKVELVNDGPVTLWIERA
jgi:D-tyrosyl-tRNA(Tyr) deacylase